MRKVDDGEEKKKRKEKRKKRMAFLVATTSLPAVYRPNGYARTTTAATPHARAKREHLNILIMYERHFHFHFVVAARLYVNTNLFSHHCMVDLSAALCNVPSIQLTKHNSSLSKPHQVRAARIYKCSAMQPACVRHFWSNYFVITMDMIYMFL